MQNVYTAVEALAKEKQIALTVEVTPNLPAARGDERKLAQVLLNLVGNAIKFTDAGEVAIKASAANGSLTVAVRDTGPGIAEAEQAKIFEEFQQAELHQSRRRKAAPGSDWRSPSASSSCMGDGSGLSLARGMDLRSLSRFRPRSSNRRGRHEQAHPRGRSSGRQPPDLGRAGRAPHVSIAEIWNGAARARLCRPAPHAGYQLFRPRGPIPRQ